MTRQSASNTCVLLLTGVLVMSTPCLGQWTKVGGTAIAGAGASDIVYAMCSNGNNIYVGGIFTQVYNNTTVAAAGVAVWNTGTSTWSALGGGISGGNARVNALVYNASNATLYVGGDFTSAGGVAVNNLAKYSGGVWSPVDGVGGGGMTGGTNLTTAEGGSGGGYAVQALALDASGNLYVGGNFNTVNGAAGFNNIAMYNGVSWSNMAGGCFGDIFNPALSVSANATVYSIAVMGNMVYAGGQFTNAGAAGGVNNIAQYNTGSGIWSAMSTGGTSGATGAYDAFTAGGHYTGWTQEPCVFALAADAANNILYAGGNFTTIGSTTCTNIGQWNALTSTWSAVGTGMTQGNQDGAQVYSLLVYNGGLLAGGDFKIATPMYAPYLHAYFIAYWDYNDWTAFSTPVGTANKEGFADDVQAMAVSAGGTLFAGGIFVNSGGGGKVNYIAQFTGVSTLPVELINFDVRFDPLTKSVDLVWTTASETNNRSFTIERTKDGDVWEPVNTVSGAGNSSTTLSYRDQDKKPLPGISYYRLKQTDYNGESTLSRSVAVNSKDQLDELRLYPNPATTQAMLSFLAPNSGEAEIQICDCTGRSVQITRHWVTEGLNTLSLDLVSLDKGLYIVNISGAQLLLTSKLILTNTHSQ